MAGIRRGEYRFPTEPRPADRGLRCERSFGNGLVTFFGSKNGRRGTNVAFEAPRCGVSCTAIRPFFEAHADALLHWEFHGARAGAFAFARKEPRLARRGAYPRRANPRRAK